MDIDRVFGFIILAVIGFRIFSAILISRRARRKGLSGGGYLLLSLFVSALIAWIALASSKPTGPGPSTVVNLRLGKDRTLKGESYRMDAEKHGDWMVKNHKGQLWAVVTTKRAYQFILDRLAEDGSGTLRNSLIEARQGKVLEG